MESFSFASESASRPDSFSGTLASASGTDDVAWLGWFELDDAETSLPAPARPSPICSFRSATIAVLSASSACVPV